MKHSAKALITGGQGADGFATKVTNPAGETTVSIQDGTGRKGSELYS